MIEKRVVLMEHWGEEKLSRESFSSPRFFYLPQQTIRSVLEAFGGQTGLQIKGERGDGPVAHGEYGDAPPAEGFACLLYTSQPTLHKTPRPREAVPLGLGAEVRLLKKRSELW